MAALWLLQGADAAAFPLLDASNADQVPQGTELATPDAQDLQHQLQLATGLSPPAGGGWSFVPRIDWQEELTDNALQVHTPRRADLATLISPGFSIAGDLPRVKLDLDFAPTLALYARTSNLNALTEQLNGLGSVTLVPDLAYVDIRAVSGVQSLYGGVGGLGTVGAPASTAVSSQSALAALSGNTVGLNRNNEVQTASFGISPYLLRRFGDWGTGKLGYSFGVTDTTTLNGFAASPFPVGGANAQRLISNEEIAHFVTGDVLQYLQNSFDIDLQQNRTTVGGGVIDGATGLAAPGTQHSSATRTIISDQVTYQVNRSIAVFASGGHEDIDYSGDYAAGTLPSIHDLTWSLGTTLTPDPASALTVSYGHQNGFNSFSANGHYALTARTFLTVSYGSTLGTQLETVRNQLNLAGAGSNGVLTNGQTGGALFGSSNALAVQSGVYRTDTLTVGSRTSLDRDIIAVDLLLTKQTNAGGSNANTTHSKTAVVSWLHQMRPTVTVSGAVSYAVQDQNSGQTALATPGNSTAFGASVGWQWQISDTLSTSLRYSFFKRQSVVTAFQIYQNVLILGISKHF